MTDIEQILLNRVKFIGDGEWTLLGTPQNIIDEVNNVIQQELLKARIETLEWLLEQEVEFGGLELKQSIIDKVAELQKELKEMK